MDHAIAGINDAVARKDSSLLRFAAKMDLILVDGLETFFSSRRRLGSRQHAEMNSQPREVITARTVETSER